MRSAAASITGMQDDTQSSPGFKLPETPTAAAAPNGAADRGAKTVTKAELAEALFDRLGLNKREAKDMVDCFFDEIRQALERGESVKLSGFGNFQLRDKPQRPGRNPKTGEEIAITARRVVTFHASQKLKAAVARATGVH
ncbi:MAG: integration host factor subunit alpha [Burkholderiaceae bacterium]